MHNILQSLPEDDRNTFLSAVGYFHYKAYTDYLKAISDNHDRLYSHIALIPELERMRAFCLVELGQIADGLDAYQAALSYNPDDTHTRKLLDEAKGIALATLEKLFDQKQYHTLYVLAKAYLTLDKNNPRVEFLYGIAVDEYLGDTESAATIFASLAERCPRNPLYHRSLVLALHHSNKITEALATCDSSIKTLREAGRAYGQVQEVKDWLIDLQNEQAQERAQDQQQESIH